MLFAHHCRMSDLAASPSSNEDSDAIPGTASKAHREVTSAVQKPSRRQLAFGTPLFASLPCVADTAVNSSTGFSACNVKFNCPADVKCGPKAAPCSQSHTPWQNECILLSLAKCETSPTLRLMTLCSYCTIQCAALSCC